jgi:hypothetical protein
MRSKAPRQPSKFPFPDVGFLGKGNKVAKRFYLLKEFKVSIFRFV